MTFMKYAYNFQRFPVKFNLNGIILAQTLGFSLLLKYGFSKIID